MQGMWKHLAKIGRYLQTEITRYQNGQKDNILYETIKRLKIRDNNRQYYAWKGQEYTEYVNML